MLLPYCIFFARCVKKRSVPARNRRELVSYENASTLERIAAN